tara:strand:+ start:722 stop:1009 length:288 start_codon:yes stop_codon:yes gene_type:complete
MNKYNFPYVALAMGLVFLLAVTFGGQLGENGLTRLPLLTLLVVSEFAFFICAIGGYLSLRRLTDLGYSMPHAVAGVGCVILAVQFLMLGIEFWPL